MSASNVLPETMVSRLICTFETPGTHRVFYYVEDGNTGDISPYIVTVVRVPKARLRISALGVAWAPA